MIILAMIRQCRVKLFMQGQSGASASLQANHLIGLNLKKHAMATVYYDSYRKAIST